MSIFDRYEIFQSGQEWWNDRETNRLTLSSLKLIAASMANRNYDITNVNSNSEQVGKTVFRAALTPLYNFIPNLN